MTNIRTDTQTNFVSNIDVYYLLPLSSPPQARVQVAKAAVTPSEGCRVDHLEIQSMEEKAEFVFDHADRFHWVYLDREGSLS